MRAKAAHELEHAPPVRILHVGNVANNAFNNARLLIEHGYECHVACYDFYLFSSTAEWQLLSEGVPPEVVRDIWFPNFWLVGDQRPQAPRWFAQGPQFRVITYLHYLASGDSRLADISWACLQYARFKATIKGTTAADSFELTEEEFQSAIQALPLTQSDREELFAGRSFERLASQVRTALRRVFSNAFVDAAVPPFEREWIDALVPNDASLAHTVEHLRAAGVLAAAGIEFAPELAARANPNPAARAEDATPYQTVLALWRSLFRLYDIVLLYGVDPVLAYLANDGPYLAYEHGTIRTLPFENSARGRLVSAAYLNAAKVFVTNADHVIQRPRLEFSDSQLVYLPHAFDERPLRELARRRGHRRPETTTFFAPARHEWINGDPQLSKRNDWIVRAARALLDRGAMFRVQLIDWGIDTVATRALAAELGVADVLDWKAPVTKKRLWEHYLDAHAVLDQFLIPSLSGISFEALALGARVITYDDGICNRTAFGKQPPLLPATNVDALVERMAEVILDPQDEAGIGGQGVAWIERYHSGGRIVELQKQAFKDVLGGRARTGARTRRKTKVLA